MRLITTLILVLAFSGAMAESVQELDAHLVVVDAGRTDELWHSDEIHPFFQFIPGSIFGNPIEDIFLPVRVDEKLRIYQDLSEWEEQADQFSATLADRQMNFGLVVEPQDARFARVGTFSADLKHDVGMGGGIQEVGSDGYRILVFAAEPCSITGTVEVEGDVFELDIHIPERGFHFLNSGSEGVIRLVDVEGPLIYLVLH